MQNNHGCSINHAGLQDVTSTSDEVEEAEHVAGGSSDEPSKNEDANMYNSGNSGFGRIEENASQLAVDARQASPAENKMTHPVATALDGKRLKCTSCKAEQKVISEIKHIKLY